MCEVNVISFGLLCSSVGNDPLKTKNQKRSIMGCRNRHKKFNRRRFSQVFFQLIVQLVLIGAQENIPVVRASKHVDYARFEVVQKYELTFFQEVLRHHREYLRRTQRKR